MKKNYSIITALGMIFIFLSVQFSNAQNKTVIQPGFKSPFGHKLNTANIQPVRPSAQPKANATISKNDFTIQKDKNYSLIKLNEKTNVAAKDFFQTFKERLNLSETDKFNLIKSETDDIGFTHFRYQQTLNGVPVNGGEYLLHEKNGKLISVNGNFYDNLSINTIPKLSKETAIKKAIQFTGAEKYLWQNPKEEQLLKTESNNPNATYYPQAELIIAPKNGIYENENFRLCYRINVASEKPFDKVDVFIDAHTGEFVNRISKINHSDVTGTGSTLYSGTKTITMDSYMGYYRLRESGRPIQTFNMNNATNYSNAVDFTNATTTWSGTPRLNTFVISNVAQSWWYTTFADEYPDLYIKVKDGSAQTVYTSSYFNNTFPTVTFSNINVAMVNPPYTVEIWDYDAIGGDDFGGSYSITQSSGTFTWSGSGNNGTYSNTSQGRGEIEVHWAMEKTYDFYLNQLSRNSYNNAGALIKNYVHYGQSYDNAFWDGTNNRMTYGDGSGNPFSPLVPIDVVGHEFSHAVIQYTANLQYLNESGALNESFADIFGTAIEFYGASSPNWTIGESCTTVSPFHLRSMSNPNNGLSPQPDTYSGTYWDTGTGDNGGVHTNSGVQNFWFYLLSQGGSGTNDIGNSYSVTGIGINPATQIAYRNLRLYLTSTSNYMSSYYGSLQAAEDLYGANSTQQNAVRAAWYAVGIGNNPSGQCSGTILFSAASGSFTDGSGSANYQDNLDCFWLIEPTGANTISLNFPTFNTEADYDTVIVYDGETTSDPVLMTWWGNTLPPTITSTYGALLVRFRTDINTNYSGWSANYTSSGTAYCNGGTLLTTPTGSFNDGSGGNNYGNNEFCYWFISPPCANNITLSFSQFNTELNYDGVIVFDGDNTGAPQLLNWSGTTIPSNVTSSGSVMLVVFLSDYAIRMQGFQASYTSTGSPYCSGTTTLNTSDWGNISDGSGGNNYCNNMDCRWLIQPPQATSITFAFSAFDVEPIAPDGFTIYDAVEIYDGTSTAAPLLGRFTGNLLPTSVTSTGGSMYIKFFSDFSVTRPGWAGYFTSTQNSYCSGTTNLTAPSGTFTDGSGANLYANNADCQWLIQPASAISITLNFTSFDTELNYDGVVVYDGNNTGAPQLGSFSGNSIPSSVTSTGGSMLVRFLSDVAERKNGWNANYNSQITGINNLNAENQFSIYPNPTNDFLNIAGKGITNDNYKIILSNVFGQTLFEKQIGATKNSLDAQIDLKEFSSGIYFLSIDSEKGKQVFKVQKN